VRPSGNNAGNLGPNLRALSEIESRVLFDLWAARKGNDQRAVEEINLRGRIYRPRECQSVTFAGFRRLSPSV
jgi:hypothetical protein